MLLLLETLLVWCAGAMTLLLLFSLDCCCCCSELLTSWSLTMEERWLPLVLKYFDTLCPMSIYFRLIFAASFSKSNPEEMNRRDPSFEAREISLAVASFEVTSMRFLSSASKRCSRISLVSAFGRRKFVVMLAVAVAVREIDLRALFVAVIRRLVVEEEELTTSFKGTSKSTSLLMLMWRLLRTFWVII